MSATLSKKNITSFRGNIIPLHIGFESEDHDTLAKADIKWESDSDCVAIRTFSGDNRGCFNNGILLILNKVGTANIRATLDGVTQVCCVAVTEPNAASSDDKLEYFIGDLHDHTTGIHNYVKFKERDSEFQYQYANYVKDENLMDLSIFSDHACILDNTEFYRGFIEADKAEESGVIFFAGCEAEATVREDDRFGITHKHSGEIVLINAAGYSNPTKWQLFYDSFAASPEPIGIFAHPQVIGFSTPGVWNFCFEKNNTPEMLRLIRGVEMGDGSERQQNLIHEYSYSMALDNGFKVSTTCSSDSHGAKSADPDGPKWGYHRFPGKTVIMASKKSREAFVDALRHNRFYACESGNLKLRYTVNGKTAPCELEEATTYKFHVELNYFKEDVTTKPINCRVISDGGETLMTLTDIDFSSFDFEINSNTARYFYLRFIDENGRRTWSCPVWTGREFDRYAEPEINEIDLANATATDILTGEDAAKLINGDVNDFWEAKSNKACIVIDLKEERDISGLGNYVRRVTRASSPLDLSKFSMLITAGFPTRIRISSSRDGKDYTACAETICRVFGDEQIITFPTVSARYVKFEVLSTVGQDNVPKPYAQTAITIGNISLFK